MGFDLAGVIIPVVIMGIGAAFLFTISKSKRPCPHCHTMMPKKTTKCPHCSRAIPVTY